MNICTNGKSDDIFIVQLLELGHVIVPLYDKNNHCGIAVNEIKRRVKSSDMFLLVAPASCADIIVFGYAIGQKVKTTILKPDLVQISEGLVSWATGVFESNRELYEYCGDISKYPHAEVLEFKRVGKIIGCAHYDDRMHVCASDREGNRVKSWHQLASMSPYAGLDMCGYITASGHVVSKSAAKDIALYFSQCKMFEGPELELEHLGW